MIRERLFAWLMHRASGHYEQLMFERKQNLFRGLPAHARRVLEIGAGTGPNIRFLPPHTEYIAMEPNPFMHPFLRGEAERCGVPITILDSSAETIPLPDNSVDAAISTLVLCSIQRRQAVIQELRRVLHPGAPLLFMEHVAAGEGSRWHRGQKILRPFWQVCADGCQLTAPTDGLLRQAGFSQVHIEHFLAPLGPISPHICGLALK